jgi:hypothetical protein
MEVNNKKEFRFTLEEDWFSFIVGLTLLIVINLFTLVR